MVNGKESGTPSVGGSGGEFKVEPFYRARKYVGLTEIVRELEPLSTRLLAHQEETGRLDYQLVFSQKEYRKYRRLERRIYDAYDRGAHVRYSKPHEGWILDERAAGGGITPLDPTEEPGIA
jgi:hypothetical protein